MNTDPKPGDRDLEIRQMDAAIQARLAKKLADLKNENARLQAENLVLKAKLAAIAALRTEMCL